MLKSPLKNKLVWLLQLLLVGQIVHAQNIPLGNDSLVKSKFVPTEIRTDLKRSSSIYNVPSQDLFLQYKALPSKPLSYQPNQYQDQNRLRIGAGNISNLQVLGGIVLPYKKVIVHAVAEYNAAKQSDVIKHNHLLSKLSVQHNTQKYFTTYNISSASQYQNKYGYYAKNNLVTNFNLPQSFYYLQVDANYSNAKEVALTINHSLAVRHTKINNGLAENNLKISVNDSYSLNAKNKLLFGGYAQTNKLKLDTAASNNLQYIMPFAAYQINTSSSVVEIGGKYIASNKLQKIFPHLVVTKKIGNNSSYFQVKSSADVLSQNLQELLANNPFAEYTMHNMAIGTHWKSSAGLVLQLNNKLAIDAHYSYNDYKNTVSYFNSFDTNNYNFIQMNTINAQSNNFDFGMLFRASSNVQITSQFTIQKFGSNVIRHLPTMQNTSSMYLQLLKNLNTKFVYTYMAGISTINEANNIVKTSAISDLHAEFVLKIAKKFSIYSQINNLLNKHNERWYGYQSYKNNFIVGLQMQNFGLQSNK